VARGYLISQKAGEGAGKTLSFMEAISTILIERALDVAIAAGLLLSTLPFVVGAGWAMEAAIAAGSLVLVGLATFYLLARYRTWAIAQFDRLAVRWPRLQGAASRQLSAFLNGLAVLTDFKRFLRAIAWMFVNWGIAIAQYFVLLSAFYPEARLLWAAFALGVTALGIAAPSSPGAVGVLELAMVGALSAFNLDPSTALAAALTSHLTNYLVTGVLGAFALARDGLTLSGVFRQAQRISPNTPGAP